MNSRSFHKLQFLTCFFICILSLFVSQTIAVDILADANSITQSISSAVTEDMQSTSMDSVAQSIDDGAIYNYMQIIINNPGTTDALKSRISIFRIEATDDKSSTWVSDELDLIKTNYGNQGELPEELYKTAKYFRKNAHALKAFQVDEYIAEKYSGTKYGMLSHAESVYFQIHKKRYDEAETSCELFVDRYGSDSGFVRQAINIVGQYAKRGLVAKAKNLCTLSFQAQPNHEDAIVLKKYLICISLEQDEPSQTQTLLNEFIASYESHPKYFREAYAVGWAFQKHQDYSTALSIYDQLLTRFPDNKEIGRIPYYKARAYLESGQIDKSLEQVESCFTDYIGWKPMVRKMLEMGCLYGQMGCTDQSQQVLTRVLKNHAKSLVGSDAAMAYVHLGENTKVQEQVNDIMESDRSLSKKHQFMIEIASEYKHLAQRAMSQNDPNTVSQEFENMISVLQNVEEDNESRHSAEAYYEIANAHYCLEEYQDAASYFQHVVDRWPSYREAWNAQYMIAVCYDKLFKKHQIKYNQARLQIIKACSGLESNYPDSKASKASEILLADYEKL